MTGAVSAEGPLPEGLINDDSEYSALGPPAPKDLAILNPHYLAVPSVSSTNRAKATKC